jgi:hypothetical protein
MQKMLRKQKHYFGLGYCSRQACIALKYVTFARTPTTTNSRANVIPGGLAGFPKVYNWSSSSIASSVLLPAAHSAIATTPQAS